MTRAAGKHRVRPPIIDPDSGEGREIGMSDRMQGDPSPIPGGKQHIVNASATRQRTPVPDSRPEITDLNAHGVDPGTHTSRERAETMRGPNSVHRTPPPTFAPPEKRPEPVPVYLVEEGSAPRVLRTSAPHSITLQASTGEGVRLCGQDQNRTVVRLLNESTSSDIRYAQGPRDLNNGGGALLPWPNNSYLNLVTQDELWAISADSGTPRISIVQEFESPW